MAVPTMVDETIEGEIKTVTRFWSCPVKFIPDSVWSFLRYRDFHEKHPGARFPGLDEISPRYLQAEREYEAELMQCLAGGV